MYDENREYTITCPYCFHEFDQEHTIFRAHTAFDRNELELSDDNDLGGLLGKAKKSTSDSDSRERFLRFDREGGKKVDTKLINFWRERGGSNGYTEVDKTWDHPHIDPQSPEFFDMICREVRGADIPGEDGFVRDDENFIKRVLDRYSDSPMPMERLCPSCHNPMPLADYGKYPTMFISVVGITGAGKTVFLNQLLTKFAGELGGGRKYAITTSNLNAIGESINPGSPLPAATDDKIMRRPLAATLRINNNGVDEYLTLVFYDIAGENCVNEKGDKDVARAKGTIGNFIAFCDGLIFLLDPEQIPAFANGAVKPNNIANVVSVLSDIRENMNNADSDWNDIPVAICLAKSDKLDNSPHIPADNAIFSHTNKNVIGFDREEHKTIDVFLREFLEDNAHDVVAPLNTFRCSAFFAVSAITCGVESRFEKFQNEYILDEDNEQKFQMLRDWASGWNKRTAENRVYYAECPVLTKEGHVINIPLDKQIEEKNAKEIITEIRAFSEKGRPIYLTLWDVATEVNLVGYPISSPAPRRVGEPLKWLLWKKEKVGPYYIPDPVPTKGIFQSQRRYDEILDAYYAEQARRKKVFYGDPLD